MTDTLTKSQNVSTSGECYHSITMFPKPWKYDGSWHVIRDRNGREIARPVEMRDDYNNHLYIETMDEIGEHIVAAANAYYPPNTFCTQDCVWVGSEIERLRNENARLKMELEGMRALCNQQAERLKEPTEEDKK